MACIENYIKQLEEKQNEASQSNQAKIKLDLAEGEVESTEDDEDELEEAVENV